MIVQTAGARTDLLPHRRNDHTKPHPALRSVRIGYGRRTDLRRRIAPAYKFTFPRIVTGSASVEANL